MNKTCQAQRRTAWALTLCWLALLYGFVALDFVNMPDVPFGWAYGRGTCNLLNGTLSHLLDMHLVSERSFVFKKAQSFFAIWIYRLTGEVRSKVRVGRGGWLFHEWTVHDYGPEGINATRHGIENIARMRDWLRTSKVEMLFVLVPSKVRIYPEYLHASGEIPTYVRDRYQQFNEGLRKHGIPYIDLETTFLGAKKRESLGDYLYQSGDHHWTDTACLIASQQIASVVRQVHPDWCGLKKDSLRLGKPMLEHDSKLDVSLYSMLGFPSGALKDYFVHDSIRYDIECLQPITEEERAKSPFILIGDSFAFRWRGFMRNYLELTIETPVQDYSVWGGEHYETFRRWVESGAMREKRPRLLICVFWEQTILNRYLDQFNDLQLIVPDRTRTRAARANFPANSKIHGNPP